MLVQTHGMSCIHQSLRQDHGPEMAALVRDQATDLQRCHDRQLAVEFRINPIGLMYGISTYIYHKIPPNVRKYTIHGSYWNG